MNSRSTFNPKSWLSEFGSWLKLEENNAAYCTLCDRHLITEYNGRHALKQHEKSDKHRRNWERIFFNTLSNNKPTPTTGNQASNPEEFLSASHRRRLSVEAHHESQSSSPGTNILKKINESTPKTLNQASDPKEFPGATQQSQLSVEAHNESQSSSSGTNILKNINGSAPTTGNQAINPEESLSATHQPRLSVEAHYESQSSSPGTNILKKINGSTPTTRNQASDPKEFPSATQQSGLSIDAQYESRSSSPGTNIRTNINGFEIREDSDSDLPNISEFVKEPYPLIHSETSKNASKELLENPSSEKSVIDYDNADLSYPDEHLSHSAESEYALSPSTKSQLYNDHLRGISTCFLASTFSIEKASEIQIAPFQSLSGETGKLNEGHNYPSVPGPSTKFSPTRLDEVPEYSSETNYGNPEVDLGRSQHPQLSESFDMNQIYSEVDIREASGLRSVRKSAGMTGDYIPSSSSRASTDINLCDPDDDPSRTHFPESIRNDESQSESDASEMDETSNSDETSSSDENLQLTENDEILTEEEAPSNRRPSTEIDQAAQTRYADHPFLESRKDEESHSEKKAAVYFKIAARSGPEGIKLKEDKEISWKTHGIQEDEIPGCSYHTSRQEIVPNDEKGKPYFIREINNFFRRLEEARHVYQDTCYSIMEDFKKFLNCEISEQSKKCLQYKAFDDVFMADHEKLWDYLKLLGLMSEKNSEEIFSGSRQTEAGDFKCISSSERKCPTVLKQRQSELTSDIHGSVQPNHDYDQRYDNNYCEYLQQTKSKKCRRKRKKSNGDTWSEKKQKKS